MEIGRREPKGGTEPAGGMGMANMNSGGTGMGSAVTSLKKIEKSKKDAKSEKEASSILNNMLGSLVTGAGRTREKVGKRFGKKQKKL